MRVLVFGATGMLGNTLFKVLSKDKNLKVFGTIRKARPDKIFTDLKSNRIIPNVNVENVDSLINAFTCAQPEVVINCIGIVKQLADANIPLKAIPFNSQLPHQLSELCKLNGCKFLQISTDCVFSGKKGNYIENDFPDAKDLYGRSKLLGEVNEPHAITIRTSIIGPELSSKNSLLEWFLAQENEVRGFSKAIFSGLTTFELSTVIKNILLCRWDLSGIYHVAGEPINKFDLLQLIAKVYKKAIHIIKDESLVIDRSLNAERFHQVTGYIAPPWIEMISTMYAFSQTPKIEMQEIVQLENLI